MHYFQKVHDFLVCLRGLQCGCQALACLPPQWATWPETAKQEHPKTRPSGSTGSCSRALLQNVRSRERSNQTQIDTNPTQIRHTLTQIRHKSIQIRHKTDTIRTQIRHTSIQIRHESTQFRHKSDTNTTQILHNSDTHPIQIVTNSMHIRHKSGTDRV